MATPNYDINYDDSRFKEVESNKTEALSDLEKTYAGMIKDSDKYYQAQIDASKQWEEKQTALQNEQLAQTKKEIEQQKDQAKKGYTKEQSGAYVDWQKQANPYGTNAEKVAQAGLQNAGYSESSQVSMYNTYQNRVATAREAYNRAVLNYDNSIRQAELQNNSVLAEIAYEALQQQLELSLQGFQYKNQLVLDKANKKTEIDNIYYSRYQDVLAQINHENALAEQIRQYNEQMAEERRQYNASLAQQQAALAEEKRQFDILHPQTTGTKIYQGKTQSSNNSAHSTANANKEKIAQKKAEKQAKQAEADAYAYLNKLIASGASKDKVSNEIAIALREGAITKTQAQKLRNTFTPRGLQY